MSCSNFARRAFSKSGSRGCATLAHKRAILARLDLAQLRHFGDCRSVGEAVLEMRIDIGPGYRVYFLSDSPVLILLCGGDKSTQERDIERAKSLAREQRDGTL